MANIYHIKSQYLPYKKPIFTGKWMKGKKNIYLIKIKNKKRIY